MIDGNGTVKVFTTLYRTATGFLLAVAVYFILQVHAEIKEQRDLNIEQTKQLITHSERINSNSQDIAKLAALQEQQARVQQEAAIAAARLSVILETIAERLRQLDVLPIPQRPH